MNKTKTTYREANSSEEKAQEAEIFSQGYYSQKTFEWWINHPYRDQTLRHLANYVTSHNLQKQPLKVFEPACGCGVNLTNFLKRFPQFTGTGIDLSPEGVQIGNHYGKGHYQEGDAENLPFSDGSFDIVLCIAAVHHFHRNPARFLHEATRILRPGGIFYLLEPHKNLKLTPELEYKAQQIKQTIESKSKGQIFRAHGIIPEAPTEGPFDPIETIEFLLSQDLKLVEHGHSEYLSEWARHHAEGFELATAYDQQLEREHNNLDLFPELQSSGGTKYHAIFRKKEPSTACFEGDKIQFSTPRLNRQPQAPLGPSSELDAPILLIRCVSWRYFLPMLHAAMAHAPHRKIYVLETNPQNIPKYPSQVVAIHYPHSAYRYGDMRSVLQSFPWWKQVKTTAFGVLNVDGSGYEAFFKLAQALEMETLVFDTHRRWIPAEAFNTRRKNRKRQYEAHKKFARLIRDLKQLKQLKTCYLTADEHPPQDVGPQQLLITFGTADEHGQSVLHIKPGKSLGSRQNGDTLRPWSSASTEEDSNFYFQVAKEYKESDIRFSTDVTEGMYPGAHPLYLALQLAFSLERPTTIAMPATQVLFHLGQHPWELCRAVFQLGGLELQTNAIIQKTSC